MAKKKDDKKFRGAVRVIQVEVVGIEGGDKDAFKAARDRWMTAARAVQRVANTVWAEWLAWHVMRDSRADIKAWLDRRAVDGPQAAGKCPVECMPRDLGKRIYDRIAVDTPELHSRCRGLAQQKLQSDLATRKAAKGSLPGWSAKLLGHEAIPSFTRPLPIPFDRANLPNGKSKAHGEAVAALMPPVAGSDDWRFAIRLSREDDGSSVEEVLVLRTSGQAWKLKELCSRIARGEWKFMGSQLTFREDRGKWFVMLAHQRPCEPAKDVDPTRVAVLVPMRSHPWSLRIEGAGSERKEWRHRDPLFRQRNIVREQRRRIAHMRRQRQTAYRCPAEGRKGHGRVRAIAPMGALRVAWDNFCRTCNQQYAARVVKRCIEKGAGRLVYFQPAETWAASRFLAAVGKGDDVQESSGWQWHQMATMLASKCQFHGLEFEIRKIDDAPNWWESGSDSAPKAKRGKRKQPVG